MIHLFAKRNTIELVERGLVEPFTDAVRLRALGLGARVIDVLNREIQLVFVPFGVAAELAAAISQHAQQLDIVLLEERQHTVVEEIGRRDRRFAVVELGKADLGVGVNERLLVNSPHALQIADIERILGTAVARMLALELAVRLLLGLGLLQRNDLRLGQNQALLGALGFQRFEPLLHGLQVVAQPHTAHASRRDREPALPQFVGNAHLTEGRLLDRQRYDGILDLLRHAVLQHRLLAADLLQSQFAALVVELLEPVEAVAAVAHHFAGLADIAELLGELQQANLGADNLLFSRHGVLQCAAAGRFATPTAPRPASARDSPWGQDTSVRVLANASTLHLALLPSRAPCVTHL